MRKKSTPPEIAAALAELDRQTDRGKAIIAGSLLEELLTEVIQKRLLSLSGTLREHFFGARGYFSTFQAKNDAALALGILSPRLHKDLELIRQIRNRFAHRIVPIDFDAPEVKTLCNQLLGEGLTVVPESDRTPKQLFMLTFTMIGVALVYIRNLPIRVVPAGHQFPGIAEDIKRMLAESWPEKSQ